MKIAWTEAGCQWRPCWEADLGGIRWSCAVVRSFVTWMHRQSLSVLNEVILMPCVNSLIWDRNSALFCFMKGHEAWELAGLLHGCRDFRDFQATAGEGFGHFPSIPAGLVPRSEPTLPAHLLTLHWHLKANLCAIRNGFLEKKFADFFLRDRSLTWVGSFSDITQHSIRGRKLFRSAGG